VIEFVTAEGCSPIEICSLRSVRGADAIEASAVARRASRCKDGERDIGDRPWQ